MKSQQQETASETINKPIKRKKGVKRKDTPEEKKAKSDAKRARNVVPNISSLVFQNFQSQYPLIPRLVEVWDELNGVEGVNLTVDKGNLILYGQVVSSACESIATCYNNYYIENFENIIANYFIYMIRQAFHKRFTDHDNCVIAENEFPYRRYSGDKI
ncbi:uncharacterized protein EV154DRAFT_475654 [Mucor mucedo]|uniref:uncharacterized protein n=1 Tax=Mucor mucedo TaxID=29922 RepID=UPI00221F17E6|nr:uncharacterized protein EV154DRAFT_475654 [Mucor mucedo]KAI7897334.1 hypothetical protein EV154DRAFT_475654 [Mucor mucedo]